VVENKHKMLNPILSRFCEIYISDNVDKEGNLQNLHQYHLEQIYGKDEQKIKWFTDTIGNSLDKTEIEWMRMATTLYENGYSGIDFIEWLKQTELVSKDDVFETVMYFHKIKSEYRNEKLLLFTIFLFIKKLFRSL
jgi:hypothetical protein